MGQRCSCDDECTPGSTVGTFEKPKQGGQFADPGAPKGSLVEVEASRFDEIRPAAAIATQEEPDPDVIGVAPAPAKVSNMMMREPTEVMERQDDIVDIVTFKASLTRGAPEEDLGMTFVQEEGVPGVLVVTGLRGGGAADLWNEAQAGKGRTELCIRRGDRVLAVCGEPREWTSGGELAIAVQRWQESYAIRLDRDSATDKLGMKLELVERAGGHRILRIGAVGGGLLAVWNAVAVASERWHEVVSPGTEVVKVGALEDCPEDMMTALQEGDVALTLQRPELRVVERAAAEKAMAAQGA